jgi:hypothetical protein
MSKKYIICIIIMLLVIWLWVLWYFLWDRYACIDVSPDCLCIVWDNNCGCYSHKKECSFQILMYGEIFPDNNYIK